MIPDKIYLDEDMIRYHVLNEKLNESDIEYIRKDKVLKIIEQSKGMYPLSAFVFISEKIKEL